MKQRFILVYIFFSISLLTHAQYIPPAEALAQKNDSITYTEIILRPYGEFGMLIPRNSSIQKSYDTKSMFFWGAGFQLNHPLTSSFFPYVSYLQTNYTIYIHNDSIKKLPQTFRLEQVGFGFVLKMFKMSRTAVSGKIGYTHGFINDDIHTIHNQAYGFAFGIGLERRILEKSKFYIDFAYNYQKIEPATYRDFDLTRFSFGFCF